MAVTLAGIKHFLQIRTAQERLSIFVGVIIALLAVWLFLWELGYQSQQTLLRQQIKTLQIQINMTNNQHQTILRQLNNPDWKKKREILKKELQTVYQSLKAVSTHLVSESDMIHALKSILEQYPELKLLSLTNTGSTVLNTEPNNINQNIAINRPASDNNTIKLYRHDFILQFEGSYFAVLGYLKKLENLPWQFYWDSIDYTVSQYPKANITVKLHTASTEENLI